jgi:hypothetical protein
LAARTGDAALLEPAGSPTAPWLCQCFFARLYVCWTDAMPSDISLVYTDDVSS